MDLTTCYLGLSLPNPLVASAGPLNGELDTIRRLEDLGAGAVVLPSIFQEQIEREERVIEELITAGIDSYSEALSYFPAQAAYAMDPERYLDFVRRAIKAVDIPVIASLNGVTDHGWSSYAQRIEEAGARAIELNIYFIPSDLGLTGHDVERRYLDIVKAVRKAVTIPIAVKIGPYFSAPGHMAQQLVQEGANGLVLFNRFYQPDIDLTRLALVSDLELSRPYEIRLPLLWISLLSGQVKASLAASTGVESADEVIKYLLAGADVVMTTSSLLRHGIAHVRDLLDGLKVWLEARGLESVDAIRGRMSERNVADHTAFERANYIKTLQFYRAPQAASLGESL
ncbi:MAG TPA: dihydroorotate dehydrogenase-like protein [Acetobacteraceae bacterium]|nr:dihydroorotate dehydrogenase-like protein [Acetobacteraceae bacterium]